MVIRDAPRLARILLLLFLLLPSALQTHEGAKHLQVPEYFSTVAPSKDEEGKKPDGKNNLIR